MEWNRLDLQFRIYTNHMMDNKCHLCFPSSSHESAADSLDKLDTVIHSLEMRIAGMSYQCKEHLLRAKKFRDDEKDQIRFQAEISQWRSKKIMYAKYVNLQTNVQRIRDQIDGTSTLVEIAGQMSIANKVLEEALKNINPEKIEELMDKLQENADMVQEVNGLLSNGIGGTDFDEEKALLELEERKTVAVVEFELPSIKEKEIPKINNKILDLEI